MNDYGKLYLCATPMGNLDDITLRVLKTLQVVDLIACEDTRQTLKLLNHFNISKPVTSYYEHNKSYKGEKIIAQLLEGKNVALVSDAGMPAIADPGFELAQDCLQHGIAYTVLPGANAALTGLVLSGLSCERFCFEGFLPRQKNQRRQRLTQLAQETRTMIFYEAPHRLLDSLQAMAEIFGADRPMAVARELTKKFEETFRGSLDETIAYFNAKEIKGEFVLVVSGAEIEEESPKSIAWALACVQTLIDDGMSEKEAIKQAAKDGSLPKREVYNAFVAQKDSR